MLEELAPGRELAWAYAAMAHLRMLTDDTEECLGWGTRAIALAESLGEPEIVSHASATVGSVEAYFEPAGFGKLERSLEVAIVHGFQDQAARSLNLLSSVAVAIRRHHLAGRYIERGLEYSVERQIEYAEHWLLAQRARLRLEGGDWNGATDDASAVLRAPRLASITRTLALTTLGLLRARRGDPNAWAALDAALELVAEAPELQRSAAVGVARAESFWLAGQLDRIGAETESAFQRAVETNDAWVVGELAVWRQRAGVLSESPAEPAEPYALQLAGDWRGAARQWRELGCPYEAGLALADADNEGALRESLEALERLGARPAAAIVIRRLRERGVRGLPRGPRARTRANAAQLTARELDVLRLVAEGLRNAAVADRLCVSTRTVDHHVSAVLRKLDVSTRGEAVAKARRLGLLEEGGERR